MTRVRLTLDMEVSEYAEFREYLRHVADWLELHGMMDVSFVRDGRVVGRVEEVAMHGSGPPEDDPEEGDRWPTTRP